MSESPALVLASTSRYRAATLERIAVPFVRAAPGFDEEAHRHLWDPATPERFAETLARGKAESVAEAHPGLPILAGDQIAVLGDRRLDKPHTIDRAVDQLMALSGRTHRLVTAIGILDVERAWHPAIETTRLTMRAFGVEAARAYVERFQPLDCCGSYRIEDAGIRLFDRIEGDDHSAISGVPLLALCRLLRAVGVIT